MAFSTVQEDTKLPREGQAEEQILRVLHHAERGKEWPGSAGGRGSEIVARRGPDQDDQIKQAAPESTEEWGIS